MLTSILVHFKVKEPLKSFDLTMSEEKWETVKWSSETLSAGNQSTLLVMSVASRPSQRVAIAVQNFYASWSAWYWSEASVCLCRLQRWGVPQEGSFPASLSAKGAAWESLVGQVKKNTANCHPVIDFSRGERCTSVTSPNKEISLLRLSSELSEYYFIVLAAKTRLVSLSFIWGVSHRHLGPLVLPVHLKQLTANDQ